MTQPLRPMRLGEILDRTIQIYRSRALVFAALGAISAMGSLLITILLSFVWPIATYLSRRLEISPRPAGYMTSWLAAHFTLAIQSVLYPAYVFCTAGAIFGSSVSIRRGFRTFRERWRTYASLGAFKLLLQMIVPEALAIGFVALVGVAADHMSGENPLMDPMMWTFVGVFLVFAYYVVLWLSPRLAFCFPACVAESLPARGALRRSFRLTRERRWSIVLVWAALWVANSIIWYALRNVLWRAMYLAFHGNVFGAVPHRIYLTLLYGSWWVIGTLLAPIFPICMTLFYYDQRIRKEGFDIEWMMHSAGMTEPTPIAAPGPVESALPEAASVPVKELGA